MSVHHSASADLAERVGFEEARARLLAIVEPLAIERIRLQNAHGRILAAALHADEDLVPYARSAMDGFAVRAADTAASAAGPVQLRLAGSLFAGDAPRRLIAGEAIAVATGAALPSGADAVVPIENTRRRNDSIVLDAPLRVGQYVFDSGDDAKRGDLLVRRGDPVSPGRGALLAAAGHAWIPVFRRPRVSIVCTGDEVIPIEHRPIAGQIRNSNATMLAGQLQADGADLVASTQAPDSAVALRASFGDALAAADLVITTGGASVGERDLVKSTLASLGARFTFRSVALRPAKPTAFGRCGDTLVAVLPGNPAAAFVGYAMLVRGAVRRLSGRIEAFPGTVTALLVGSIHAKPERHFVTFGRLFAGPGGFTVEPLDNQCSSLVRTSAEANALIVTPPGTVPYPPGAAVQVEVLDWSAVDFTTH